jgi:hypothetical protein
MDLDTMSHYHFLGEKKLERGIVRIEASIYAPRSEMAKAFEEMAEVMRNGINLNAESPKD